MKIKKGDTLVCTNNNIFGLKTDLKIGDKYVVLDTFNTGDKTIVEVYDEISGKNILSLDRNFIHLEVYREWKIEQITK